jgi:hypothetical protein
MPRKRRHRRIARGQTVLARTPDFVSTLGDARREMVAQRALLDGQITALDRALAAMGSPVRRGPGRPRVARVAPRPGRGGRRGRRAGSLKEFIARVLRTTGAAMAVKDVTAGVRKAGYATRNKTLAKSVGIALTQMPEVRKVKRGQFRLK